MSQGCLHIVVSFNILNIIVCVWGQSTFLFYNLCYPSSIIEMNWNPFFCTLIINSKAKASSLRIRILCVCVCVCLLFVHLEKMSICKLFMMGYFFVQHRMWCILFISYFVVLNLKIQIMFLLFVEIQEAFLRICLFSITMQFFLLL